MLNEDAPIHKKIYFLYSGSCVADQLIYLFIVLSKHCTNIAYQGLFNNKIYSLKKTTDHGKWKTKVTIIYHQSAIIV